MRRIPSMLTVLAALLLATALSAPVVVAQDDAMSAAEHPLVGAWIIESSPDDPTDPLEVVTVGPGGTITDTSLEGVGSGVWAPTGEFTADATFVFPTTGLDGSFAGFVTIRTSVEVAEDGQTFAGTYTLELPAAMVEALGMTPGQTGPGEVTGQRIVLEPMGEVVGPLPEEPEEPAAEDMPEESPSA
jgi:hypothetical protein